MARKSKKSCKLDRKGRCRCDGKLAKKRYCTRPSGALKGVYPTGPLLAPEIIQSRFGAVFEAGKPGRARKPKMAKCSMPNFPAASRFRIWTQLVRTGSYRDAPKINSSADAYQVLLQEMRSLPQEEFFGVFMDNHNRVLGTSVLNRGTAQETVADPVSTLRTAILSGATRFIVAHNHPSGDTTPSPDDVAMTRRLDEIAKLHGIPLLDHMVIGQHGYASMRDLGLIGK